MARGTISKKQNRRDYWEIQIDMGLDPVTGRRRRKSQTLKGTRKDAEKLRTQLLHRLDTDRLTASKPVTLGKYIERWLENSAAIHVRSVRTLDGYRSIARAHLLPKLGHIRLDQLRPAHIEGYYKHALTAGRADGKAKHLSAQTVKHHHRLLKQILKHAVRHNLLVRNPADMVDPPFVERKERPVLDTDELLALDEASKETRYYPLVFIASRRGLRLSELLGLQWRHIDLQRKALSVEQALHHTRDGRIVYQAPKSAASRRMISMNNRTVELLTHMSAASRRAIPTWTPDTPVFANPDGTPWLPSSVSHGVKKLMVKIGRPDASLHSLRHSHTTAMLNATDNPKTVQGRLGHASIITTFDLYSHVMPDRELEAIARLSAIMGDDTMEMVVPMADKMADNGQIAAD